MKEDIKDNLAVSILIALVYVWGFMVGLLPLQQIAGLTLLGLIIWAGGWAAIRAGERNI